MSRTLAQSRPVVILVRAQPAGFHGIVRQKGERGGWRQCLDVYETPAQASRDTAHALATAWATKRRLTVLPLEPAS